MIIKRLLLSAAIGVGLFFPAEARSAEPVITDETPPAIVNGDSQGVSDPIADTALDLEIKLAPQPDGRIDREITFSGNANEVIVLMMAREDELPIPLQVTDLYSPTGEQVRSQRNYPEFMTFGYDYFRNRTQTFLLPETGDYRLILGGEPVPSERDDESPAVDTGYVVQVRAATYYERLLISAETLIEDEQYPTAFSRLALAVDNSPATPAAYISRVSAYGEMLYESPVLEAQIAELDFDETEDIEQIGRNFFALIYEIFRTLDAVDQAVVKDDFRQLDRLYTIAIANGDVDPTETEISADFFDGIADFLETGVPTETMRVLFFGSSEQTQAPL